MIPADTDAMSALFLLAFLSAADAKPIIIHLSDYPGFQLRNCHNKRVYARVYRGSKDGEWSGGVFFDARNYREDGTWRTVFLAKGVEPRGAEPYLLEGTLVVIERDGLIEFRRKDARPLK